MHQPAIYNRAGTIPNASLQVYFACGLFLSLVCHDEFSPPSELFHLLVDVIACICQSRARTPEQSLDFLQTSRPARCASRQVVRANGDIWYGADRPKFLVGRDTACCTLAYDGPAVKVELCRVLSLRASPPNTYKESSPEVRPR